jgi:dethiobiotin synthetase
MESFPKQIFVTGIGTGVGKTITCAVLCDVLYADYWKPIQTGSDEFSDAEFIIHSRNNPITTIHQESYVFKAPASPLIAAELENCTIDISKISLPKTCNNLVIEGAGGALVHLTKTDFIIDLAKKWNTPVVLVVRNYLGCINHTLLTIEALKARNISILGIIYCGEKDESMRKVIEESCAIPILGSIDFSDEITDIFIAEQAEKMRDSLSQFFKL